MKALLKLHHNDPPLRLLFVSLFPTLHLIVYGDWWVSME